VSVEQTDRYSVDRSIMVGRRSKAKQSKAYHCMYCTSARNALARLSDIPGSP
jgi:hypothetical protein